MNKVVGLRTDQTNNDAAAQIEHEEPYTAAVEIVGSADLLFHRWSNEAVEQKAKARKGSAAKKTDNVESYVYRNEAGVICLPGEYLRGSIIAAAKFRQDPRSPRKSAMDLFKAGIVSLTALAPLGAKTWDYEDRRRVLVQRNAITRVRPAFRAGWRCSIDLMVNVPEYIDQAFLLEVLGIAGRLIGVGDFRPTFGRFDVTGFKVR
jgi:hypothetical protein